MARFEDFTTEEMPTWCPGCGNFPIHLALKKALVELVVEPEEIAIISGIGCGSKTPHWIKCYGFHSIHGRALPIASGLRLANHDLTILVISGDGDCYGIGLGHFIHAARRNLNIACIVENNKVYGLTKGQSSPTSDWGYQSVSTPNGVIETPINPLAIAISAGATYVARGFSGDINQLQRLIVEGVKHRGFSLIDVLQPCVTFNKLNTYDWYNKRVYKLEEEKHDFTDIKKAFEKAEEWGDRIPTGLFYKNDKPSYGDELPQIAKLPLVEQRISNINISGLMEEMI